MSLQIFLSHAAVDVDWVRRIEAVVAALGVEVYLFEYDVKAGSPVADKVLDAIRRSDAVIVLLTEAGSQASFVHQEIGAARAEGKPLIPIVESGIPNKRLGMLTGLEYIELDLDDPHPAMAKVVAEVHLLLEHQQQQLEISQAKTQERLELALALTLVALVYLAATQS